MLPLLCFLDLGGLAALQEMMMAEENVYVVLRLMCLLSLTQARSPCLIVHALCCWWVSTRQIRKRVS